MDEHVNYTAVGAFVIIFLGFIIFSIIWLSSGFKISSNKIYKVYMSESVTGLNIDSTVEFNGVNVGTVSSIEIDQKNPHLVTILLKVKKSTPVSNGTRATLNTKGLTGVSYVSLIDKGNDFSQLPRLPDEPYPIIQTAPSFLGRLDLTLHKLVEGVTKVSSSIEMLLDDENLQSIKEILIGFRHVTRTLAMNTEQMNAILKNTAKASTELAPLMQSTMKTMSILSAQILPATNQAMTNLDIITNNLSAVSLEIKENPAVLIRGKDKQPLGPGEK